MCERVVRMGVRIGGSRFCTVVLLLFFCGEELFIKQKMTKKNK